MQKERYSGIAWTAIAPLVLFGWAATLGSLAAGRSESLARSQSKDQNSSVEKTQTKVVLLGTGTPRPFPDRSGPATAIVVGERAYLVDFGPGVVRRAAAAAEKGTPQLESTNLKIAFLTHLHADHTAGYPDLILTPWILGRTQPIDVYGPTGLRDMTRHVRNAWKIDIDNRVHGIDRLPRAGCRVNVHEIEPGIVYTDRNVSVTAFRVRHGEL